MELGFGWLVGRFVGLLVSHSCLFKDALWTEYVDFNFKENIVLCL